MPTCTNKCNKESHKSGTLRLARLGKAWHSGCSHDMIEVAIRVVVASPSPDQIANPGKLIMV
jgi:hypothetical protein